MNQQSDGQEPRRLQTIADELLSTALFYPGTLPTRGDEESQGHHQPSALISGFPSALASGYFGIGSGLPSAIEPSLLLPPSSALPSPPTRLAENRVKIKEALITAVANIARAIETSSRGELETARDLFGNETREQLEKAIMKRMIELDIEDKTSPFCTVCQGECIEGAMVIMSCGHFFHAFCALQHMVASASIRVKRCPLCATQWHDPHGFTYLENSRGVTLTICNDMISKRA